MTMTPTSVFEKAAREIESLISRIEQLESEVRALQQGRSGPPRTAYRPSEVAAMTGFKVTTIQAWIREGRLEAVDVGGRWAVAVEAVEKLFGGRPAQGTRAKGTVQADVPRHFWSVREFASTLGVALDTVYRLMRDEKLAWTHIGGEKRIPNTELERLLSGAYAQVSGARST